MEGTSLEADGCNLWYLGTACFNHVTGNKNFLTNYTTLEGEYATFGGVSQDRILGRGDVDLPDLKLKNVLHVENLKINVISVAQLCDGKCSVEFGVGECIIRDADKKCILRGTCPPNDTYAVKGDNRFVCNPTAECSKMHGKAKTLLIYKSDPVLGLRRRM